MEFIAVAVETGKDERPEHCPFLQPQNRILEIKRPSAEPAEDKENAEVSNLVRGYEEFDRRNRLDGRQPKDENDPRNERHLETKKILHSTPAVSTASNADGKKSIRSLATRLRSPSFFAARSPASPWR
jgi:hypothetical protein